MTGLLYLENRQPPIFLVGAVIDTRGDRITSTRADGFRAALTPETLAGIILGPGCTITTKAVRSITSSGCAVHWTSKTGLRIAATTPAATTSNPGMTMRQAAALRSEPAERKTHRSALTRRFGEPPPDNYGTNQLRGWEGIRAARRYQTEANVRGIAWDRRKNTPSEASDYLNALLSHANAIVYTACEAATASLLMSPHLGYCHVGTHAWVYDIADCFKDQHSLGLMLDWFAGRDRSQPLEAPIGVALDHYPQIMHGVFSAFYGTCDAILPPAPAGSAP